MEYPRYFAELVAALLAMISLAIIVALLLRTYKIPECFSCGARKVRPTHSVGFWDTLGSGFPYPALPVRRLPRAFLWISPLHRSEKTTRRTVSPTPTSRKSYLPVSPWPAEPYCHPRGQSVQGKWRSQAGSDLNISNLDCKSFLLLEDFSSCSWSFLHTPQCALDPVLG